MAERRANDLSYGHVGEATYNIDEGQWGFSLELARDHAFHQLIPFTTCQPPSKLDILEVETTGNGPRSQRNWLLRTCPETFPASLINTAFAKSAGPPQAEFVGIDGRLLALGGAIEVVRLPKYRRVPIIAIPHGDAGSTLRLIKPRREDHGWGKHSSVKLECLDATALEHGHWIGTGGRIHQIEFAEGDTGEAWLAVRQLSVTTIFRPLYQVNEVPATVPDGFGSSFPLSRIDANPVACLTAEQTGSISHADVAFNPYYARQFAVVDTAGFWRIWNIEHRKVTRLIAGKGGTMDDGKEAGSVTDEVDSTDGWHRIVWAADVSTVVVCNRRSLNVFDLTSAPRQLPSPRLLPSHSTDWILDVKRSQLNLHHIYVLTSSRIFWLEVISAGVAKDPESPGARLVVSYRHYRDPNDETLKLVTIKDRNVSTLIVSGKSKLVTHYKFSFESNGPVASQSSFVAQQHMSSRELQSIVFIETPMRLRSIRHALNEPRLLDRGVTFFQSCYLATNLELGSALFTIHDRGLDTATTPILFSAPTSQFAIKGFSLTSYAHRVRNPFIIPNGYLEEGTASSTSAIFHLPRSTRNPVSPSLNWIQLYECVFGRKENSSETTQFVAGLHAKIAQYVQQDVVHDSKPLTTLFELSQPMPLFSKDLEDANLHFLLNDITTTEDENSSTEVAVLNLNSPRSNEDVPNSSLELSSFIGVYDRLVAQWIKSLPRDISDQTRLSIFNTTRKIAVELCLSSIALYHRVKATVPQGDIIVTDHPNSALYPRQDPRTDRSSLPPAQPGSLSQLTEETLRDGRFGLLTPAQTPSLHSGTSVTSGDPDEDPAVVRLRQYAISVEAPEVNRQLRLLSQWPSAPGSDPAHFIWKPDGESNEATPYMEQKKAQRMRREEARRKRRTEAFLAEESSSVAGAASQPAVEVTFGSQPVITRHPASSQVVNELPMTQPGRGTFGSRTAEAGKKKQRRRKTGF